MKCCALYFRKRESAERRTEEKYRPEQRNADVIGSGNYRERNERIDRNERVERGRQSPRGQRQERDRRLPVPEFRDRREDVSQGEWRGRDRAPGKSH